MINDKKKVLLVSSLFSDNIWNYPELSLGLAYIATELITHGHQVEALDLNVVAFPFQALRKKILRLNPDFIGISCTYGSLNNAIYSAEIIRSISDAPIILGGIPATFASKVIAEKTNNINIYIHGEGEKTFCDIVNRKPSLDILGISFLKDGVLTFTGERLLIENIDHLGVPCREIFPLKKYKIPFKHYASTVIETTRGCPYNCDFCTQSPKEGTRIRSRSIPMVQREIQAISRNPFIKRLMFVDNDFLTNHPDSRGILEMIVRMKFNKKLFFFVATRVETLIKGGDDLLDLLVEANVRTIFIGVESLSDKNIKQIRKVKSVNNTKEIVRRYLDRKIDIMPSYMIGYMNETIEDIQTTVDFAKEMNTKNLNINIVTPYPGTKLYERYLGCGHINDHNLNNYDNCHQVIDHDLDLEKAFIKFHRQYYFRWRYFNFSLKNIINGFNYRRILMFGYCIILELVFAFRVVKGKLNGSREKFILESIERK